MLSPYQSGDEAGIQRLLSEADLVVDDLDENSWSHFVVLRRGDQLVGAAAIQPCSSQIGLLRSVVLDPAVRHHGYGRRLVTGAEDLGRENGLRDIYLLTNTAAPFFSLLGYREIDRQSTPDAVQATAEFQQLCPASAVVMRKIRSRPL